MLAQNGKIGEGKVVFLLPPDTEALPENLVIAPPLESSDERARREAERQVREWFDFTPLGIVEKKPGKQPPNDLIDFATLLQVEALEKASLCIGDLGVIKIRVLPRHLRRAAYERWALDCGLSWRTVEDFVYVCANVPRYARAEGTNMAKMKKVAPLTGDPETQRYWLERAVLEGWSAERLGLEIAAEQTKPMRAGSPKQSDSYCPPPVVKPNRYQSDTEFVLEMEVYDRDVKLTESDSAIARLELELKEWRDVLPCPAVAAPLLTGLRGKIQHAIESLDPVKAQTNTTKFLADLRAILSDIAHDLEDITG